jgi:hypothetical protein
MNAEIVFKESPEYFDASLESEQTGVTDVWGVGFREDFVERGKRFCCEFEF